MPQGGVFIMCDNDPKSPVIQARYAAWIAAQERLLLAHRGRGTKGRCR